MNTFIILILGIVIGFGLARVMGKKEEKVEVEKDDCSTENALRMEKVNEEKNRAKEENKGKVLEFLKEKKKVTNNEIEKLLGVSDATATRYLEELEKDGKVRQVGEEGSGVYYELVEYAM